MYTYIWLDLRSLKELLLGMGVNVKVGNSTDEQSV